MKKTLTNIFDEANANELENLISQNTAPDVSADTLSSIKDKVYAKTGISKSKAKKPISFRWQSYVAAACLLLIVGAVTVMAIGEYGAASTNRKNAFLELSLADISIDTTVLQDQTFTALSSRADSILNMYQKIAFDSNEYLRYYISVNDGEFSTSLSKENSQITLNTASYSANSHKMQYLVMLSWITKAYSDCMIPIDYNYQPSYNRLYIPVLFVCPSYRTSGYDSIVEYYEAVKAGTIPMPADAYEVSFYSERIENCSTGKEINIFSQN